MIDRLIVLELKIQRARPDQPIAHFAEVKAQLYRALRQFTAVKPTPDTVALLAQELRHGHRRVWKLIDLMHAECSDADMALWARETVRLNDRRADLVGKINAAFGLQNRPEKV